MCKFIDRTFRDFDDRDSAQVFENTEFHRCHFDGCDLSITRNPNLRSTIRNASLFDCTENGCSIGTAIVEDVVIDTLRSPGLFQTFGAVFKHVVLRGKMDRIMISSAVDMTRQNPGLQEAFDRANSNFYRRVDWALDISQGEFKELDLRGVPGRLIRRDPETQILITRRRALEGSWRDLAYEASITPLSIKLMLEGNLEDFVLIAPKRSRKFKHYLHDLQLLREAGIADPD